MTTAPDATPAPGYADIPVGFFLGSYRFDGDPDEMVAAHGRLVAQLPPGLLILQLVVRDDAGITVFDACPDQSTFAAFSTSPDFAAALTAAGLPAPVVTQLGEVAFACAQTSH